jgi:hypothetical protein
MPIWQLREDNPSSTNYLEMLHLLLFIVLHFNFLTSLCLLSLLFLQLPLSLQNPKLYLPPRKTPHLSVIRNYCLKTPLFQLQLLLLFSSSSL